MSLLLSQMGWMRRKLTIKTFIIAFVVCFFASQADASPKPLATVKQGTNQVLHILQEHSSNQQQQETKIRGVVDKYFDFHMMAKQALGPYWNKLKPAKQNDYVKAFSQFLFNQYINKIEKYRGQKITYEMKGTSGSYAIVNVVVAGRQTGKIPIAYRLHQNNGTWQAYDVVIQGVSLVNNYRSQFKSILARHSFADLMQRLKQKNAQNQ